MRKTLVLILFLTPPAIFAEVPMDGNGNLIKPSFNIRFNLPEDKKQIIDAIKDVEVLAPHIKEKETSWYALRHLYKIPLFTLFKQKSVLIEIKNWVIQEGYFFDQEKYWPLLGILNGMEKEDEIHRIDSIQTWDELFKLMDEFSNDTFYYFPLLYTKAHELPIKEVDIERFTKIIEDVIGLIQNKLLNIEISATKLNVSVYFIIQTKPNLKTIDLVKKLILALRDSEFKIKSTKKNETFNSSSKELFSDYFNYLYKMNLPEADAALLEILKYFIVMDKTLKQHLEDAGKNVMPKRDKHNFEFDDDSCMSTINLCFKLRNAQIEGVTSYLRTISEDEKVHSWIREQAKESAEWREKNSKFQ